MMKKTVNSLLVGLVCTLLMGLSSCALFKGGNCDCPNNFGSIENIEQQPNSTAPDFSTDAITGIHEYTMAVPAADNTH